MTIYNISSDQGMKFHSIIKGNFCWQEFANVGARLWALPIALLLFISSTFFVLGH
jgi:hypothetical protein